MEARGDHTSTGRSEGVGFGEGRDREDGDTPCSSKKGTARSRPDDQQCYRRPGGTGGAVRTLIVVGRIFDASGKRSKASGILVPLLEE